MSGIMSALVGNSGGTNNFTVTVGVSGSGILTSYGYNGLGLSPYQPGAISPLSNVLDFGGGITTFQWSGLGNPFGTTSGAQIPAVFS